MPPLPKAIERYTEETVKDIGRTKAQVLRTIATCPIADLPCSTITLKEIIEFLQSLPGQPQTVGTYASHLASIFAIARPMWDFRLDDQDMRDAITVARRTGIISRSAQRNRNPLSMNSTGCWPISLIGAKEHLRPCSCTR